MVPFENDVSVPRIEAIAVRATRADRELPEFPCVHFVALLGNPFGISGFSVADFPWAGKFSDLHPLGKGGFHHEEGS